MKAEVSWVALQKKHLKQTWKHRISKTSCESLAKRWGPANQSIVPRCPEPCNNSSKLFMSDVMIRHLIGGGVFSILSWHVHTHLPFINNTVSVYGWNDTTGKWDTGVDGPMWCSWWWVFLFFCFFSVAGKRSPLPKLHLFIFIQVLLHPTSTMMIMVTHYRGVVHNNTTA